MDREEQVQFQDTDFVSAPGQIPNATPDERVENFEERKVCCEVNELLAPPWREACEVLMKEDAEGRSWKAKCSSLLNAALGSVNEIVHPEDPIQSYGHCCGGVKKLDPQSLTEQVKACRKALRQVSGLGLETAYLPTNWDRRKHLFVAVGHRYLLPQMTETGNYAWCGQILGQICLRYNAVPYHNVGHATTVMHHAVQLARFSGLWSCLTAREKTALVLVAAAHDVGHPGFSNGLIDRLQHPLAGIYNNRNVLENYHASVLFSLLRQTNWEALNTKFGKELRNTMTQCILWTDIQSHDRVMAAGRQCLDFIKKKGGSAKELVTTNKAVLRDILGCVVKGADLSYLALENPFHMLEHAINYSVEMQSQRAYEQALAFPLCDSEIIGSQKWFDANATFLQHVAFPVANLLAALEHRIRNNNPANPEGACYLNARLTDPTEAVVTLREAKLKSADWPEAAIYLCTEDNRELAEAEAPQGDDASPQSQNIKPSVLGQWITRQASRIRSANTAKYRDTLINHAFCQPMLDNIDLLKKAKYFSPSK